MDTTEKIKHIRNNLEPIDGKWVKAKFLSLPTFILETYMEEPIFIKIEDYSISFYDYDAISHELYYKNTSETILDIANTIREGMNLDYNDRDEIEGIINENLQKQKHKLGTLYFQSIKNINFEYNNENQIQSVQLDDLILYIAAK